MWPASETLELSSSAFAILRDIIHSRTGLFYDDAKRQLLAEKLSPYVIERGFSSFLDFYYLLKYGPTPDDEWLKILDVLSVQETYFWREMAQIKALSEDILPSHLQKRPNNPVRIWCAACATGEEPITIAMALSEDGWTSKTKIEIWASDGSCAAISHARRGIYRERSFRTLPRHLQDKYFTKTGDTWKVAHEQLPQISWHRANLVDPIDTSFVVDASFVFCRNVFIYFSDEAITRTLSNLSRSMARPGCLFVGASESLLRLTDEFELQTVGDAFVYVLT